MVIETKDLGFVEIQENDIIHFPRGIYAFEESKHFVLLRDKNADDNPFMWLQCTERKEPCFVVVDPDVLFNDYKPLITPEAAEQISFKNSETLRFLLIATVPKDIKNLYLNLKCPIVINSSENTAMQVILDSSEYPMRYYLFNREGG